jgi:hypothetical protein
MLFRELAVLLSAGDLSVCWQAFINALVYD